MVIHAPWSRITAAEVANVVGDSFLLAVEFAHLVNSGQDSPRSSDIVARVQAGAARPSSRGKRAVDHAHLAAGGSWLEDDNGVRNKERERGPLTALQARVFWMALVQPRYTP